MTEKAKKPLIRFKGFTEDWEQRKVSEIANRFDNLRVPVTATDRISGDTPYYGANGIQDYVYGYTHDGEFILVAEDGANDLKNYPVQYVNGRIWVNNHAHVLQNKDKLSDNKFLKYSISNTNMETFLVGGGRAKLNSETLMNIELTIPQCDEQIKLGDMFYKIDDLITLHQRKYDKLTNVKKALLDKMFPQKSEKIPKIRFKGFTEAWEQRKLGDIVEFYSGLTYTPNDVVIDDKETLVLRSSNVKNGEIVKDDNVYVKSQVVNSDNVKCGDIIVVVRNGSRELIGKHAEIKENMPKTVIGAFMTGVRSNEPEFLNSLLSTNQFDNEIEKNLGATINQITTGNFTKMQFIIPNSNKEKNKIGKLFLSLDNLITLHQRECEKLKNVKKSLLEKMFV